MSEQPEVKAVIEYDDFAKLDLAVGKVTEVGDHPNADKLLVMKVDLGGETRQIIAGLKGYVSHEDLLGLEVVVVKNLAPRKMRGLESQGMILAASWLDGEGDDAPRKVVPLTASKPAPAGAQVS